MAETDDDDDGTKTYYVYTTARIPFADRPPFEEIVSSFQEFLAEVSGSAEADVQLTLLAHETTSTPDGHYLRLAYQGSREIVGHFLSFVVLPEFGEFISEDGMTVETAHTYLEEGDRCPPGTWPIEHDHSVRLAAGFEPVEWMLPVDTFLPHGFLLALGRQIIIDLLGGSEDDLDAKTDGWGETTHLPGFFTMKLWIRPEYRAEVDDFVDRFYEAVADYAKDRAMVTYFQDVA